MKARSPSSSTPTRRFESTHVEKKTKRWACASVLRALRALGEKRKVEGMARFGIRAKVAYGVPKPKMDLLARTIGRDHRLALELWASGVHDARILTGMIDEPDRVTPRQMERWVRDFDNWDVCDGTCCHLFVFAKPVWKKAIAWSQRREEFAKRAGFALMAYLAYRDQSASDARYLRLLPPIRREARDERNFVKKAVNWAAEQIHKMKSREARWIATDALRELRSNAVQARLRRKARGK